MRGATHPVADVVRRTDVDERPDAALEEGAEEVLRGEAPVVEVRAERGVDGGRAVGEVAARGRIDTKQFLCVRRAEEGSDIPARRGQV